jgi:membrane-associated phospholipid phosphatase
VGPFEDLPRNMSYPSGHTAAALVLYGSIAITVWNATRNRLARALALVAAIVFPAIVAISRMYRGMHNPTDTMAGYAIGVGCLVVAIFAVRVGGVVAECRERHRAS